MSKANLSKGELERYDRQIRLPSCGDQGQRRLKKAKIGVIGAGGLGCTAMTSLVSTGVGELRIFDFDRVSLSNLHRQPLYRESDIGEPKAFVAQKKLQSLNPYSKILAFDQALRRYETLEICKGLDLILDCTDRFSARANISSICTELSIPHCYASVSGRDGQLALFEPHTACFRCLFPTLPTAGIIQSCDQGGVLGVTAQMVAGMQAQIAIDYLLTPPRPLEEASRSEVELRLISTLPLSVQSMKLSRSIKCEFCVSNTRLSANSRAQLEPYPMPISSHTLNQKVRGGWNPLIVDVREAIELKEGRIQGSLHLPLSMLEETIKDYQRTQVRPSSDTNPYLSVIEQILSENEVLVYCARGPRAERAALALHQMINSEIKSKVTEEIEHKSTVYELIGGYSGWSDQQK